MMQIALAKTVVTVRGSVGFIEERNLEFALEERPAVEKLGRV
jgi:hypothetical protein